MRIGIDMLAVQSPDSRGRGIGRFGLNLVHALLARDDPHEYVLYAHDGFPDDAIPVARNATVARLAIDPGRGEARLRDVMNRLASTNPHDLDALLLISPFELCPGYDPPARPLNGLKLATVMHDLIPFLFQEKYLPDDFNAAWFYRRLNTLRRYDLLLTNSDATRSDCLKMMALPEDRVVTIGGAGNGAYFRPDRSFPMPSGTRVTLHRLGIRRPYVFCLAGLDDRKNLRGLMDAFRLLPVELRRMHQLVVTCYLKEEDVRKARRLAEDWGLADNLVLTGEVPDETLRILYQRCSAFAFPSLYEGLGLPILEAMHCGAAVIAGNNSSQVEVVGDAGLLVNAGDAGDIADALRRVLEDPDFARRLGERGVEHAKGFTWERSAGRAVSALARVAEVRPARRPRRPRPRVAMFSPWPPKGSGISDYSARLVEELSATYAIDLYHEPGYVPEPALASADFPCYDARLFRRMAASQGYRGVVYQMGNSFYHEFFYDMMGRYPGVVTLHDFNLTGFHFWRAHRGPDPVGTFLAEVDYAIPGRAGEVRANFWAWNSERGGTQEAFVRRGLPMNRRVLEWAEAVVFHSPWCVEKVRAADESLAAKSVVIPMGAATRTLPAGRRDQIRDRFGLPREALVFGSFGILTQAKMNVEAIDAFAAITGEFPEALFILVGADWENGEAKARAEAQGLSSRVRFLGRQPDDAFADLIAAADVGVSLRRPPTYGETSAALLDLLGHGIPTVVTDVATFADYPDGVVRKARWPEDGHEGLVRAFRELAGDAAYRERLGRSAFEHVATRHSWRGAAERYAEVIERCHEARRRSDPERSRYMPVAG